MPSLFRCLKHEERTIHCRDDSYYSVADLLGQLFPFFTASFNKGLSSEQKHSSSFLIFAQGCEYQKEISFEILPGLTGTSSPSPPPSASFSSEMPSLAGIRRPRRGRRVCRYLKCFLFISFTSMMELSVSNIYPKVSQVFQPLFPFGKSIETESIPELRPLTSARISRRSNSYQFYRDTAAIKAVPKPTGFESR